MKLVKDEISHCFSLIISLYPDRATNEWDLITLLAGNSHWGYWYNFGNELYILRDDCEIYTCCVLLSNTYKECNYIA